MKTEANATDDLQTLDASELGKLIGRSTMTVRLDARRRPETLPPLFAVPGCRKLRWRVVDVRAWMQALADLEAERRRAAVEAAQRTGTKTDFGYKPFALAAAKNGRSARERMDATKQALTKREET